MKYIKKFLIIVIIILIVLFLFRLFKTHHSITYTISKYKIKEDYSYKKRRHTYVFNISRGSKKYSYIINDNLDKKKKVIKDIKTYNNKNISCIIPIYKSKKMKNSIYCLDNNESISLYLSFKYIDKEILDKYNISTPFNSRRSIKYKSYSIYKDNIDKDSSFIVWNYKGIYLFQNNNYKYIKFLSKDLYDNIMSVSTDRYYYLFDNRSVDGISVVYRYDIKKDRLESIKLDKVFNKASYINGAYNGYIYITDTKSHNEYRFNTRNNKIATINNGYSDYKVITSSKTYTLDRSEFFNKNIYFDRYNKVGVESLNYYYYYKDGSFYRKMKNGISTKLFNMDNVDEWRVYNDSLLIIKDGVVYEYRDIYGLREIFSNNELKYNYKNICSLIRDE